ncbi:MAG: 2-dehydropantoate 2-reductase [Planctomycetota bacterium]
MSEPAPLRVGVFGAGAVGCYVGGRLAQAPQVTLLLVGRPRLAEELHAHGLTTIDLDGTRTTTREVPFVTEAAPLAETNVVLCCVKSRHTDAAGAALAEVLAPDALVVSLQNGVRNAEVLRARLPGREVLAGVVGFNVVAAGEGVFRHTTRGPLQVERSADPRARRLHTALAAAGLPVEEHADMAPHQWTKLVVNLNNAVSALSGAPTGDLLLVPGYRRIVAAVVSEGIAVLRAAGLPLSSFQGVPLTLFPRFLRLPTLLVRLVAGRQLRADPAARSSMWQDLTLGRETEVDFLNGEVVRVAAAHGLAAPLNQRLVELVHEAERRATGPPDLDPTALAAALGLP